MEFHNHFNQRAEAERWLNTAVKLLTTRDLHGTKSFAIRARESDPRLGAADQLIAVADTLLAGESRINNNQPDYYAILQLARRTHSLELVATQYRRLALLLSPQANRFPYADQAFRLVSDAWTVLSNPSKKAIYDHQLPPPSSQLFERQFLQMHGQSPPLVEQQRMQPPQLEEPQRMPPPQQKPPETQQSHQHRMQPPQQRPSENPQSHQRVRQSPRKKDNVASNVSIESEPGRDNVASNASIESEPGRRDNVASNVSVDSGNFWTACPYCYHLFEYSRVYEDCMLRCQSCKRAFHAVVISSPPVMDNGDASFCCWAYYPMGLSPTTNTTSAKDNSVWSPFSTIYAVPLPPTKKKKVGRPALGPRVYREDEEDPFLDDISDPSEDSGDEWHNDKRRKKKVGRPKGKASVSATPARASDRIRKVTQNVMPSNGESSSKTSASARKRGAAALGKLDLNVEFSNNEVEAQTMSDGNGTANGEEDNIEGIGFFEGLDEFLSSLPILNVVGDDKVKAN